MRKKEDLEDWKSEIEFELQEAAMFFLADHQAAMTKYKTDLEQWEKLQSRMVSKGKVSQK